MYSVPVSNIARRRVLEQARLRVSNRAATLRKKMEQFDYASNLGSLLF